MSKRYKTASNNQMAARIVDREDNIYSKKTIKEILDMYADECAKSLLKGERVRINSVCTIYPEVKTSIWSGNPSPYRYWKIRKLQKHE